MKGKKSVNPHAGSSLDSLLDEEGIRKEVEVVAVKRALAWQLAEAMKKSKKTKHALAKELHTSRSQIDRVLDPENIAVSLATVSRAARALGKRVVIRIADARAS